MATMIALTCRLASEADLPAIAVLMDRGPDLVAALLGAAGYLIGGQRDGEIDLSAVFKGRGRG